MSPASPDVSKSNLTSTWNGSEAEGAMEVMTGAFVPAHDANSNEEDTSNHSDASVFFICAYSQITAYRLIPLPLEYSR